MNAVKAIHYHMIGRTATAFSRSNAHATIAGILMYKYNM